MCHHSALSRLLQQKTRAMSISLITKLKFSRETLSNACFTSMEQVMTPNSGHHSLADAAMSLMAVEISVVLLPSSKPEIWMLHQLLSLFSMFIISISSKIVTHPQYHLASTLWTQIPLVCPTRRSITSIFGKRTMMFLSQVSMSSLF